MNKVENLMKTMWLLIFSLVLFPSPSYSTAGSSSQTEATVASEPATAPQSTSGSEEVPAKTKKPLQLNVSTDDFYLHNPKIVRNPAKVENFSKSMVTYSSIRSTDSSDNDVGLDKTRSFSRSLFSQSSIDKDNETEPEKLDRFSRSLSRGSTKDLSLRKFDSFSKSLSGSSRFSTDSDSDAEVDEAENLPSSSMSKSSLASMDIIDEGRELEIPSTPQSFLKTLKAYSAEDIDLLSAAINHNFWVSLNHQVYTASITPYVTIQPPKQDIKPIVIKGLKMVRSVTVLRHSIRLPTAESITEMKVRLPQLKKLLKEAAGRDRISNTDNWWYSQEMEDWTMYDELAAHGVKMKTLVRKGKKEASKMGKRYRTFYKYLLPEKFEKKSITVKFTDCPRTKDTALSFIEGMYEELPEGDDWYEEVESKESVLKYDSTCIVWKSFKKSDFNRYVSKNFLNGVYMRTTASAVAVRCNLREDEFSVDQLQFLCENKVNLHLRGLRKLSLKVALDSWLNNNHDLKLISNSCFTDDLILVYEICSFEVSWIGSSPWCALLTVEHMKVLEFAADLELYIIAGYANVLNTKIPCKLYNDLMHNLLKNENLKALFYVTHLTSILKFLAFLGLYQDTNIRLVKHRQRYNAEVEERNWRTAYIGSFLTNISFTLFEDEKKRLWIQVRHQERPVHIPMCPLNIELLCPLDTFEMIFERFSYHNCQFDEWCKKEKIFPKQNNKYLQKSYSVGVRRENLFKQQKEAEKEAERNKGAADEEHEKDYRRIKSTGNIEHEKTLEKESLTETKNSKTGQRELSEKAEQSIKRNEKLSVERGQQEEKSKEKDTDEGEAISEAKKKHTLEKKKSSQEMKPIEETKEKDQPEQKDVKIKLSRSSRFRAEFGDDSES